MKRNFDQSYALLVELEGGFVNNKHDRGGKTNRGVTERVYHRWLRERGEKLRSVLKITAAQSRQIAVQWYYRPVKFNALPDGIDLCAVDMAFNSGPERAIRFLQGAINKVSESVHLVCDGKPGKKTLAAARNHNGTLLIHQYVDDRLAFFMRQSEAEWLEFGDGWTTRTDKIRAAALSVYERRKAEDKVASPTGVFVAVAVFSGLLWALSWGIRKTIGRIFNGRA